MRARWRTGLDADRPWPAGRSTPPPQAGGIRVPDHVEGCERAGQMRSSPATTSRKRPMPAGPSLINPSTNQGSELAEFFGQQGFGARLQVEAQERLGIGGAKIEPPV